MLVSHVVTGFAAHRCAHHLLDVLHQGSKVGIIKTWCEGMHLSLQMQPDYTIMQMQCMLDTHCFSSSCQLNGMCRGVVCEMFNA